MFNVEDFLLFSDNFRYGRKIVMFATIVIQTVATFVQAFSTSWAMFCAFFFFVGGGNISNYVTAFVLGMFFVLFPFLSHYDLKKSRGLNVNCSSNLVSRSGNIGPTYSDHFLHCWSESVLRTGIHATAAACFPY